MKANKSINTIERQTHHKRKTSTEHSDKNRLYVLYAAVVFVVLICLAVSMTSDGETTVGVTEQTTETPAETTTELDLSSLPENIVNLYKNNPDAEDYVLSFAEEHDKKHKIDISSHLGSDTVPLFVQWDKQWGYLKYAGDYIAITGCGPTCLSMVAFYLTQDVSMTPKKMAEFSEKNGYSSQGGGSPWILFSQGAVKLGFNVEEVQLSESKIAEHLKAGTPIVCNMGPGDFTTSGHYVVFREYKDGKIYINDPNSYTNSNKAWKYSEIKSQIRNMWAISK